MEVIIMKFSDAYKIDMDHITVSENALNRVNTYLNSEENAGKKSYIRNRPLLRSIIAAASVVMILVVASYHSNSISAFAQSLFGNFIFDIAGKQVNMGEREPVKFDADTFLSGNDVEVLEDEDNSKSYWKNYDSIYDLKEDTGINMIASELLVNSSSEDNYVVHYMPKYYTGHLNGDFNYGDYHVNVDGMFVLEGFDQEIYGYGTAEDDKYDFTYEAANGITVYFVDHSFGYKMVLQAGNILYQINSDAPVKELKRLVDSFKY